MATAIFDRNLKAAQVYAFERDQMTAESVSEELEALGVRSSALEIDVTDREATERGVAHVVDALGRVDIAVCNAGGGTVAFADELPDAQGPEVVDQNTTGSASDCPEHMLTRVLETNLMSCMYTCMAVAPYMKRQKAGKIVTVSSVAGVDARGGYHPYGTAKAAIIQYTRALAQDLGPFNINVNCIAPGIIRTGRLGDQSERARSVALRRTGTIEDCAKVVEFLVTDLSDYVTGRTIVIDGGLYH